MNAQKPKIRPVPTATGTSYHVLDVEGRLIAESEDQGTAGVMLSCYVKGLAGADRMLDFIGQQIAETVADAKHAVREAGLAANPPAAAPIRRERARPIEREAAAGGSSWADVERVPLTAEERELRERNSRAARLERIRAVQT